MSEYNIQMNKYNALNAEYDQLYPKPMKHANTHAKDGSDPITPASIGAYTKTEADALLAKKMVSELGQAGANLLEWANSQAVGGCFYINPTVTTADVPIVTWYAGLLEINGGGRRMIISTSGGGSPITYVNVTSAGVWNGWQQLATATDLDTKVSKSGDTMTGDFRLQKANNGYGWILKNHNANVDFGLKLADLSADGSQVAIVLRALNRDVMFECDGALYNLLHSSNAQTLGFPKIAIGSYAGTGTYSSANANSLTFDFVPKLVIIVADARTNFPGTVFINGQSQSESIGHNYISNYEFTVGWSGNTVTWYTTNSNYGAEAQLNKSGVTYRYIALG